METTTPTAASSSGAAAGPSTTATPSVSVLTVTVKALTTTFTPPSSCGDMHLTQLASPGYEIWLNEPMPVPGSKFGDCYPKDFAAGYTSAPMFSPLVCPQGWNAVKTWANGYIACCASGFMLHPPETTVDENRPAFGGTCYSGFTVGQAVKVTAYNSASLTATADWTASVTNDQVYAHVIDGFQLETADSAPSARLSGGAIAGAVVGSIVGLIAILLAVFFLLQRYRRRKSPAPFDGTGQFQQYQHNQQAQWDKDHPDSPSTGYLQSPYYSTTGTFDSMSPPFRVAQRYELGSQEPRELDSGWSGQELESPKSPQHQKRESKKGEFD
ncbi:hypothetical protein F4677DRAFT_443701 [Hypoxylon crocopeplum]|nr:hypothetical protein F4677DRAFT_443701 [Hypoxylon crocopeplum]